MFSETIYDSRITENESFINESFIIHGPRKTNLFEKEV